MPIREYILEGLEDRVFIYKNAGCGGVEGNGDGKRRYRKIVETESRRGGSASGRESRGMAGNRPHRQRRTPKVVGAKSSARLQLSSPNSLTF